MMIIFCLLCASVFFYVLSLLFKGTGACIKQIKNYMESDNFVLQSRYEFFLNKYKVEEKRVIEKADRAVMNAQMLIGDVVDNPVKKKFLQAFVDYHKYNCINRLINYSKYEEHDMYDVLDPFFTKAAEKIVQAQELEPAWSYELLGSEYDFDREQRMEEQLYDNGILDKTYEGYNVTICVKTLYQLHKILKNMKGKSLLTRSDKERLNSYFEQRRMELVGNHKLHEVFLTDIPNSYKELVNVYKDLCKSKFLCGDVRTNKR